MYKDFATSRVSHPPRATLIWGGPGVRIANLFTRRPRTATARPGAASLEHRQRRPAGLPPAIEKDSRASLCRVSRPASGGWRDDVRPLIEHHLALSIPVYLYSVYEAESSRTGEVTGGKGTRGDIMTRDAIRDALRARIRDIPRAQREDRSDLRREQNPLGGDWDENAILLENDQVVEALDADNRTRAAQLRAAIARPRRRDVGTLHALRRRDHGGGAARSDAGGRGLHRLRARADEVSRSAALTRASTADSPLDAGSGARGRAQRRGDLPPAAADGLRGLAGGEAGVARRVLRRPPEIPARDGAGTDASARRGAAVRRASAARASGDDGEPLRTP